MRELALRIFRSNAEIQNYLHRAAHLQTIKSRRAAVRIAVVDDEPFAPQANLQSYGYVISPIGDIKNLDEVSGFHMVLCDVMGVGRHFDTKLQGASLIGEIKNAYPEKIVVAYTGAALNDRAARLASERADRTIKKDVDVEEWTAHLDDLAKEAVDPFVIWNKVRARFVQLNVDTKDILVIEDAYVRAILQKDDNFSLLKATTSGSGMRSDVRAIVQGLASSVIFKAIFGS
jgi:hypothetical protein